MRWRARMQWPKVGQVGRERAKDGDECGGWGGSIVVVFALNEAKEEGVGERIERKKVKANLGSFQCF